jgi:hypothetical protein
MYADPIKHVRLGGLVVTVDLLVRRTVISNDVYKFLDHVLNARMVSIQIDVFVLISVRLMVSISKEFVLPVLMSILDRRSLSYLLYNLFILEMDYTMLVNLCGGRIYMQLLWQFL